MKPAKKYAKHVYPVVAALRDARKTRRLPRKQVALVAGYGHDTIGRWERGETRPSCDALHDWSAALGLELRVAPRLSPAAGALLPAPT